MDTDEFLIVLASICLVFIPALALTARFALKPIVESIVQLRQAFSGTGTAGRDSEIRNLHQEIAELRRLVEDLQTRDFDRALTAPHGDQLLANRQSTAGE
ncbi:MAG: hypothetical protein ACT4O1_14320 [Gemmatimonadota bacterium]